jgi:hypothetical protein
MRAEGHCVSHVRHAAAYADLYAELHMQFF